VLGEGAPGWARWALLASLVALDFPASPVPTIVAEGFWLFALPLLALVPWLVAAPPVVGQTGETR